MVFVGIDVAKDKHDCCILDEKGSALSTLVIANDRAGFERLLSEIKAFCSLEDAKIGLESTGHYSVNIQNFLLQKRLCVTVFNPLQVNMIRKAETLRKTKTDRKDAAFLARLLMSGANKPYQQPVLAVSELRILTRNRYRLVGIRSKHKQSISRLITTLFPELPQAFCKIDLKSVYALLSEFPTAAAIAGAHLTRLTHLLSENSKGRFGREKAIEVRELARSSIGLNSRATGLELQQIIRLVQQLHLEIDLLDREIRAIVEPMKSPILSIPGIGYTLGAIIIAEIGDVRNFSNPSKLLAFAGLEPSTCESGQFTATRTPMVKRGSKYLRWAMLQAAVRTAQHNETFGEYLFKKRSEGKHFFVAISHSAKKLMRVIFHLLRYGEHFGAQELRIAA